MTVSSIKGHIYVHVMARVLWTGIDIFMGAVLGPVVGGLDDEESAAVFQRLTPKTAFLLPSLAFVTIATVITAKRCTGRRPGLVQLLLILDTVYLRWGGVPV